MKQLLFATLFFAVSRQGYSQVYDLPVYSNGFIYTDTAMQRLKHVFDSLNIKYKHCTLNRKYLSVNQGLACYITLENRDARAATTDMLNNISFADLIKKYPAAEVDSNLLLTARLEPRPIKGGTDSYTVWRPKTNQALCLSAPGKGGPPAERFGNVLWGKKGNWVFDYHRWPNDPAGYLQAIYIVQQPVARLIPGDYAKLISYADCMIDTTSGIHFKTAKGDRPSDLGYAENKPPAVIGRFLAYVNREADSALLKYHPDSIQRHNRAFTDSLKQVYIEVSLSKSPVFRRLLSRAVEQTLRLKLETNDRFEYYTELYCSKSAALAMKRNRLVFSDCGEQFAMLQVLHIVRLAAETSNWQVFLRAHLAKMDDQFNMRDTSNFARATRRACVKELETLDIDVQDLLLGISFDISNPPINHYFGLIWRLAPAFIETKDSITIETRLLSAIRDMRLDYYNRLRLRDLFLTYVCYLRDKEHRMACIGQLKEADKSLPAFLLPNEPINYETFEKGVAGYGY